MFNCKYISVAIDDNRKHFERFLMELEKINQDIKAVEATLRGYAVFFETMVYADGQHVLSWEKMPNGNWRIAVPTENVLNSKPLIEASIVVRLQLYKFIPDLVRELGKTVERVNKEMERNG